MRRLAACLVAWALAGGAFAAAPRPVSPAPAGLYAGRWYDIAHTPNSRQKNCQGATSDFAGWDGAAFTVVQTCHKGGPLGPARLFRAKARIVPGSGGAKFKVGFLGGLIRQEYWILDHAADNRWAILATPGGHYVWLLSRDPSPAPGVRAFALARVKSLGYDAAHLEAPRQESR